MLRWKNKMKTGSSVMDVNSCTNFLLILDLQKRRYVKVAVEIILQTAPINPMMPIMTSKGVRIFLKDSG